MGKAKKPIAMYSKETGELIKTYESQGEAARENNIDYHCILFCATGRHKTAGGYYWKYVDNE